MAAAALAAVMRRRRGRQCRWLRRPRSRAATPVAAVACAVSLGTGPRKRRQRRPGNARTTSATAPTASAKPPLLFTREIPAVPRIEKKRDFGREKERGRDVL